jgi:hypothetical protein
MIMYDSPYTFNDANQKAKFRNVSLREYVLTQEKMIEDPRMKGFLDSQTLALSKARTVQFKDGAEGQFAYNGFTVLDLNIRKPMFNVYAMKHVPHIYGGGATELDKGFFFNYATQKGRLASGNNNKVNLVKSNVETLQAPIEPITLGLFVGQIDLMKAQTIGYDVIGVEGEAVRYSYQVELDKFAFVGHRGIDGSSTDGSTMARGLINQASTDVTITDLETATGYDFVSTSHKKFEVMSTGELVNLIIGEYNKYAEAVVYSPDKLPNKWLIYPSLYASLVKPAYISSSAGTVYKSHLEYLKAQLNEVAIGYGGPEVMIDVLPYLAPTAQMTAFDSLLNEDGTNNTGRTILYRQDPYLFRSRLALDLTPGAMIYDPANNGYRRNYVAFIGTPLVFYPTAIRYIDNGTTTSAG